MGRNQRKNPADQFALCDRLQPHWVSSFVSAAAVPSLRDAADVFAGIKRRPGTIYTALIPNRKGSELALAARADELNFVMSASETHNRANMNMTRDRSLTSLGEVVRAARDAGIPVNATIATAFGARSKETNLPKRSLASSSDIAISASTV